MPLADPGTLGVAWLSVPQLIEADNLWAINGIDDFDVETVSLHEVAHALGLGHSPKWKAIMYATYLGPRTDLDKDDENGTKALYQDGGGDDSGNGGGGGGPPCSKKPDHPNCDLNK